MKPVLAKTVTRTPMGERIDAALKYAGMSQNDLERVVFGPKSRGRISRYSTGSRGSVSLDPGRFERMADLLGVDFHWLLTGRGRMTPPLSPPEHTEEIVAHSRRR